MNEPNWIDVLWKGRAYADGMWGNAHSDREWAEEHITPWTVLKLEDGTLSLVGDVNPLLGVCDDCQDILAVAHLERPEWAK